MTNSKLLQEKIASSGLKKCYLAQKIGLSRAGFRNCIINKAEFTASQIEILCAELGISSLKERQLIFFASNGS